MEATEGGVEGLSQPGTAVYIQQMRVWLVVAHPIFPPDSGKNSKVSVVEYWKSLGFRKDERRRLPTVNKEFAKGITVCHSLERKPGVIAAP